MKLFKKRNKTKILSYNPWNFDAEPGDLMISLLCGKLMRLEESRGNAGSMGILYPRFIHPPIGYDKIICIQDKLYWVTDNEFNEYISEINKGL
jgi:hypothetical protein